jgi:hypothetical protein
LQPPGIRWNTHQRPPGGAKYTSFRFRRYSHLWPASHFDPVISDWLLISFLVDPVISDWLLCFSGVCG